MASLLWLIYEAGLGLALLVAGPFLLARRGRHYLPTLAGRLGGGERAAADESGVAAPGAWRGRLWLHAVSVGEVGVAATLARALPADLPLLVTTVTPTGQALARQAFAGRAAVAYLPFDLRPALGRIWRRYAPAALVLVEGDYWPLMLREARRRGLPVAVANGRVGDRSFSRMRRLRPLARRLLFSGIGSFGVQSAVDGRRLQALGVDGGRVTVTGNLKFETRPPEVRRELGAALGRLAGARPLLIAGSTMPGEEEQVLAAFAALGGGRRALLVLAPRHPERWEDVHRLLGASGLAAARRSRLRLPAAAEVGGGAEAEGGTEAEDGAEAGDSAAAGGGAEATAHGGPEAPRAVEVTDLEDGAEAAAHGAPDVVLLDSMGELADLYRLAAAAFVGGTLAPTGGHNPLEAARYGIPIAVGPSMHNFREIAELFDRAGAWRRVPDAAALGSAWEQWLADPAAARRQGERAAALLDGNRGALARTLEMLAPLLATLAPPGAALRAPPPSASPWQRLYAGAHRLRGAWYRSRSHGLPRPVISVGNLHWGGAGKTPLVAAVARHLSRRGAVVCILSRGYRSKGSDARGVRVVSRGDGPLLPAAAAGDEPVQLAGDLPGVAVVVGADRYRAGLAALALLRPAPDLFLLDDGFSHLALRRDLDVLAFPAVDPFGGGRLWPGGRLREPLAAAARADAVLLTGAPAGENAADASPTGAALAAALRPYGFTGPGFVSRTVSGAAILHGVSGAAELPAGSKVLLVSAIAHPETFAATVRELDFAVMGELRFPDHHSYPPASLERIAAAVAASGAAAALVTSKDRVKLLGRLAVPLAELPVTAVPEAAFWDWLDDAAGRLPAGGSGAVAAGTRLAAEP